MPRKNRQWDDIRECGSSGPSTRSLAISPPTRRSSSRTLQKVIRSAQQNTTDGIDERTQELAERASQKANNKEAYDEIADGIFKLREQREKCTVDTAARDAQISRINELQDFIKQQPAHLETFDEALVKRWLDLNHRLGGPLHRGAKIGLKIDIEG